MFWKTLLQLSAVAVVSTSLIQTSAAQDTDRNQNSSHLESALRAPVERGDIPMAVAGITTADETIYLGAFGVRELGGSETVTDDSVINIAAMARAITATAAMQLVEQGKLDFDSP